MTANDAPAGPAAIAPKPCPDGGSVTFTLAELTANVTDPDDDALSVSAAASPTPKGGAAAVVSGGIVYTAAPGFFGTDTLAFTVSDGNGGALERTADVIVGGWARAGTRWAPQLVASSDG